MSDDNQFAALTDDALDELRGFIGKEARRGRPYVELMSSDAIRHFAYGIGDRNPLWTDPDYAAGTAHGMQLAPPTALYATDRILSGYVTGLSGVHAMFAGTEFNYERPIKVNDRIRAVAKLKDLIERPSKFAGRSVQQIYAVELFDQEDKLIAAAESYCFRTERDAARELSKYDVPAPVTWTAEQLADIANQYKAQDARRRGALPRYIEDVNVGDQVPQLIKGPYTATTAIAFLLGWGGLYVRAHGDAFDLYERHPGLGILNDWGVPEPPERVHWDPVLAAKVGVPGAYDYGPERVSWMGHLVTDWMGDDGFLARLKVEVRRHNLIGELVTCKGIVKSVDRESRTAHLRLSAHNQDGDESARGEAEVVLPSKDSNSA